MHELTIDRHDFNALATDVLQPNNRLRFRAYGASMYPFIKNGDIVEVRPVHASAIRRGDVILCRRPDDRLLVHRVVRVRREAGRLVTQGDAVPDADETICFEDVLGRLIAVERGNRRIDLCHPLPRLAGTLWVELSPFSRRLYRTLAAVRHRLLRIRGG